MTDRWGRHYVKQMLPVVAAFSGDDHFETHFALGLAHHVGNDFTTAAKSYATAIAAIEGDQGVPADAPMKVVTLPIIRECLQAASEGQPPPILQC